MNPEFRQKLLNWFCSVGIALLASSLTTYTFWMVKMPMELFAEEARSVTRVAGPLGETLLVYPILMAPILTWHFLDFIQKVRVNGRFLAFTTGYVGFATMMGLASIVTALIGSRFFFRNCGWERCDHPALEWLTFSFWTLVTLLAVLCIGKAAVALSSRRNGQG